MNKNRRNCSIAAVLLVGIVFILLLIAGYAIYIGPKTLEEKRLAASPPTLVVHFPATGDTAPVGTPVSASVTATGFTPIAFIELWLNGELHQQHSPENDSASLGISFRTTFDVEMTEGPHVLVFRAINSQGLVGQSIPITVTGTPNLADDEIMEPLAQNQDQGQNNEPGQNNDQEPWEQANPGQSGEGEKPNAEKPDPLPDNPGAIIVEAIKIPAISMANLIPVFLSNRPKAPASLQVGFEDCTVQLLWYDNATNENYFNIWMQRVYGPPQKIATTRNNPQNGPTRFDFQAPAYGVYNFWVEAVNELGGQSSEIKEIWISDRCKGGVSTYLEVEALDMLVFGPYEKIYCYLSLDGTPERRIPENDFIQVQNNWGDITKHWGGEKKVYYPMPEDEVLTLEGRCLGWQGSLLAELASFNAHVPRAHWDGRRLEIRTEQLLVGYRIQPTGPQEVLGSFQYIDYSLQAPQIVSVESESVLPSFVPESDYITARRVTLKWMWQGNPDNIDSFLILMDGKDFRYVTSTKSFDEFLLFSCGWEMSFEIVAVGSGGARSAPSSRYLYQPPSCPVMAEVKFISVYSDATDDQSCEFPNMATCYSYKRCDQISIYYELFALGAGHNPSYIKGGSENSPHPYKCGSDYLFTKQLGANTDKIIVPIDPSLPEVRIGTTFWESDVHLHDRFGLTGKDIKRPYDQWPMVDEDFVLTAPFMDGTADVIVKGHIRGFIFPGP